MVGIRETSIMRIGRQIRWFDSVGYQPISDLEFLYTIIIFIITVTITQTSYGASLPGILGPYRVAQPNGPVVAHVTNQFNLIPTCQ